VVEKRDRRDPEAWLGYFRSPRACNCLNRSRHGTLSHTRAGWSYDAVTIRVPSGLNAAELTEPVCPVSSARLASDTASHIRAVCSGDALTTRDP